MEIFLLFLGAILGLLLAVFIQPLVENQALDILVKWFGSRTQRRKQSLAGAWHQRWHVDSKSFSSSNEDQNVVVTQLRNRIITKHETDGRTYHTTGTLAQDQYVTGTWYDEVEGSSYYGAFQLRVLPGAEAMLGRWIGFGTDGAIKTGIWEWKRPHISSYPIERKSQGDAAPI